MYLLDVNLLLALADPMHVHHDAAHRWFSQTGETGWATCPLTESGFVRIASNPRYPNRPGSTTAVLDILRHFCQHSGHQFWHDSITLREKLSVDVALTHTQLTVLYLLLLAQEHSGKLATLDQKIPIHIIPNGADALELINP